MRRRKLPEAETSGKHSTGISIDDTSNFDEEIGSYLSATGPASPEILSLISAGKRLFYPKTVTTYPQKMYPMSQLNSQLYRKTVTTYPQKCTPKLSQQANRKAFLLRSSSGSAAAGRKATALHPTSRVTQKSTQKCIPCHNLTPKCIPKCIPKRTPKLSHLNPKMYPSCLGRGRSVARGARGGQHEVGVYTCTLDIHLIS